MHYSIVPKKLPHQGKVFSDRAVFQSTQINGESGKITTMAHHMILLFIKLRKSCKIPRRNCGFRLVLLSSSTFVTFIFHSVSRTCFSPITAYALPQMF